MYKALSPGAIGVRPAGLREAAALAGRFGFQGIECNVREVAQLISEEGAEAIGQLFASAGVRPAGFGLPVDWRGAEETWRKGLDELPRLAAAAAAAGLERCMTWIPPASDERDYEANWRFHIERFRPTAAILGEHGIRLGLEFIGPKTLRASHRFAFVHTLRELLDLAAEIGPNVGLLLDSWHWYTSHGTIEELRALRAEQVVYVHVNDAPPGIPIDEQIDNVRALPGETGVIDIVGFLQALEAIGYDGPVTPEPFKKELRDLPTDEDRLRVVSEALDQSFRRAGVVPR